MSKAFGGIGSVFGVRARMVFGAVLSALALVGCLFSCAPAIKLTDSELSLVEYPPRENERIIMENVVNEGGSECIERETWNHCPRNCDEFKTVYNRIDNFRPVVNHLWRKHGKEMPDKKIGIRNFRVECDSVKSGIKAIQEFRRDANGNTQTYYVNKNIQTCYSRSIYTIVEISDEPVGDKPEDINPPPTEQSGDVSDGSVD